MGNEVTIGDNSVGDVEERLSVETMQGPFGMELNK
jgi:hypothetical protein